jgi:hypothetical protein
MRVMPAVVVSGARQTGKSNLAEQLFPGARRYATLDDLDVLDAARRDPDVLVDGPGPVTKCSAGRRYDARGSAPLTVTERLGDFS